MYDNKKIILWSGARVSSTVVRGKGQITIPSEIRKATHLEEGDPVEVEIVEGGILLRPCKVIDATQAWFWQPEGQGGGGGGRGAPAAARGPVLVGAGGGS